MSRFAGLLVVALTLALPSIAQAEVKDSSPSGFTIENSREVPDDFAAAFIVMTYRAGGYTPDDLSKFAPVVDKVQAMQLGGLADFLGGSKSATLP